MRLYLDDDTVSSVLIQLLREAGHDVRLPIEIGVAGAHDALHLTKAAVDGRIVLTQNYDDFKKLHDLVLAVGGHYPGILVIRRDNNPKRDLDQRGIVRALAKLLAAGVGVTDQYIVLNHWR